MKTVDPDPSQDCFEVILCFENDAWSFSTYTPTFEIKTALQQAEDEFLIHSSLHDINLLEARAACVLTGFGRHFFSKQNGRWRIAAHADAVPAAAHKSIAFQANGLWSGGSQPEAIF
jgi:hypothetical protein